MRKAFPILLLLAGLSLLLYPQLSRLQSRSAQQLALEDYRAAVVQMGQEACTGLLEAAQAQKDASLLAVGDAGIIGCVTIPKLQAELPLYPGTGLELLRQGAGLLEGSSLPLGGPGCHSVLSAHRGLPEARLFTDLDRLAVGDIFTVTVLDRVLTYRVDQILTVLPQDTAALLPQEGLDLCTLVTCTPYGVNSHRLLVRGRRI